MVHHDGVELEGTPLLQHLERPVPRPQRRVRLPPLQLLFQDLLVMTGKHPTRWMLRDTEQPCATSSRKHCSDIQLLDLRTSPIIRLRPYSHTSWPTRFASCRSPRKKVPRLEGNRRDRESERSLRGLCRLQA
jgi:hypothetical protein